MVPEKNWLYLLSQFFSCSLCGTLPCRALLGHSTKTGPIKVTSGNHTAESKAECSALIFAEHPWHLTCVLSPWLLLHPPQSLVGGLGGFPSGSNGKESACNAEDSSSIPWLGRSPGEGNNYPVQYSWAFLVAQLVKKPPPMRETWVQSLSFLGNPMDK